MALRRLIVLILISYVTLSPAGLLRTVAKTRRTGLSVKNVGPIAATAYVYKKPALLNKRFMATGKVIGVDKEPNPITPAPIFSTMPPPQLLVKNNDMEKNFKYRPDQFLKNVALDVGRLLYLGNEEVVNKFTNAAYVVVNDYKTSSLFINTDIGTMLKALGPLIKLVDDLIDSERQEQQADNSILNWLLAKVMPQKTKEHAARLKLIQNLEIIKQALSIVQHNSSLLYNQKVEL